MNLRYLKNDHYLTVQDSVKTDGRFKGLSLWGDVEMEMWGRWCQFDDDSAFSVQGEPFASMYELSRAEAYFEWAWNTMVITLAAFLQSKMWPGWRLIEIPQAQRNSAVPDRFRFDHMPVSV